MANVFPASSGSSGGLTAAEVVTIAEGLDTIAADAALAAAGNPAATTGFISAPTNTGLSSPAAVLVSLANNNNIFINGVYVGGFNLGDTYEYNAAQGDVVTSDKGVTGAYAISGGAERPVEIASAAGAGRQFFWFAFRGNPQRHIIQALALESRVRVYGPNPNVNSDGTSPDTPIQDTTLSPFDFLDFQTTSTGEYYCLADQPVVLTTTNSNLNQDQRVLQPLTNELFGYLAGAGAGDARISALFANTNVEIRTQNGLVANGVASPGSPLSLHGQDGSTINLTKFTNYAPEGAILVRADGPIAGFVGADAAGTNATTFQPFGSASQLIGLPYNIVNTNNSANDGWSFSSRYEGTVNIFRSDGTLFATRQLVRSGSLNSPAISATEQLHPAAARITTDDIEFTGTGTVLERGSYVVSNVPVNSIANLNEASGGSAADDDETHVFGITRIEDAAEIIRAADGLLRRRDVDASGVETWVKV